MINKSKELAALRAVYIPIAKSRPAEGIVAVQNGGEVSIYEESAELLRKRYPSLKLEHYDQPHPWNKRIVMSLGQWEVRLEEMTRDKVPIGLICISEISLNSLLNQPETNPSFINTSQQN